MYTHFMILKFYATGIRRSLITDRITDEGFRTSANLFSTELITYRDLSADKTLFGGEGVI